MKKIGTMKTYSLDEVTDEFIGKRGTSEREKFECDLKLDLMGDIIKKTRIKMNLTQDQLGQLIGVQKAQISKIENNTKDIRISTLMRVFTALKANGKFTVSLDKNQTLKIA